MPLLWRQIPTVALASFLMGSFLFNEYNLASYLFTRAVAVLEAETVTVSPKHIYIRYPHDASPFWVTFQAIFTIGTSQTLASLLATTEFVCWYLYYSTASLGWSLLNLYRLCWTNVNQHLGPCFRTRRHSYHAFLGGSALNPLDLEPKCSMDFTVPVFVGTFVMAGLAYICFCLITENTEWMGGQTSRRSTTTRVAGRRIYRMAPRTAADPRSPTAVMPTYTLVRTRTTVTVTETLARVMRD